MRTYRYYSNHRKSIEKYLLFLASNALHGKIKKEAIVIDPIGAIVISACIVFAWGLHAYSTY
jgi:HD superfamily phosphodiesterase